MYSRLLIMDVVQAPGLFQVSSVAIENRTKNTVLGFSKALQSEHPLYTISDRFGILVGQTRHYPLERWTIN